MRVLIGCEKSGVVRRAFDALGHDVWSCDLQPADDGSNRHIRDDIRNILDDGWDLLAVMHPPCTRLTNSGVRWLNEPPGQIYTDNHSQAEVDAYALMTRDERHAFMWRKLDEGAALFSACWNANIPRKAIENPIMHRHAKERIVNYQPPAQTIQPWWFGEPAFKATSFYLHGLPPLKPTNKLVPPKPGTPEHKAWSKIHLMPRSATRGQDRSETFELVAAAMAEQWGGYALQQELAA